MGINKLGDGSKDYAAGYADGFAAGIAAGFSATSELRLDIPVPESNALASATDVNTAGEASDEHSALTEEEFDLAYPRSGALASSAAVANAGDGSDQPSAVTEEELGHLTPGCFVQVGFGEAAYWVEVGKIEGGTISGMVHPELSSSLCVINHDSCEIARFTRDQITALGCDRYCWC